MYQGSTPGSESDLNPRDIESSSLSHLSTAQIAEDPLSQIADANWSAATIARAKPPAFSSKLVVDIYKKHLGGGHDKPAGLKRIMLLELSQYLENYLWPHFSAESASYEHIMSIVLLVNEKFRENVPAWTCFGTRQVHIMTRQPAHTY